jgi:phosphoglycolate phosphatase-like HAD superfamily hydrolase
VSNVIVFDLDGVITSEKAYWVTAGLVLHEILYSPCYWNISGVTIPYRPVTTAEECFRLSHETLPEAVILKFKARSINSNWDTCYAAVSICLIDLLTKLPDCSPLLPLRPWDTDWIAAFRQALAQVEGPKTISLETFQPFETAIFQGYVGLEIINRLNHYASIVLGHRVEDVFGRYSSSWKFCRNIFQEWYLGDELYMQEYGHIPKQTGKRGCIYFERPLLPVERLRGVLEILRSQGYVLGIATGRPGQEATIPLQNYGLLEYFDEKYVVTDVEVSQAEARLEKQGKACSLVKPHPYPFLRAANPDYQLDEPLERESNFIVVGDTPSDVYGGRAAGAITIAVLTGARSAEARTLLEQSQPDFLVEDVTKVPVLLTRIENLATIRHLQSSEREKAERLLLRWFARHTDLRVDSLTLMPQQVSMNALNGICRVDDREYFFKIYVEEQAFLEEYDCAVMLSHAGYNVVVPLRTICGKNQRIVIYPMIRWPVMFDLMRVVEIGSPVQTKIEELVAAEKRECERLLAIYQSTLAASTAEEHATAPIHQLFWHRLTGGRLSNFYASELVPFPDQQSTGGQKRRLIFEDLLHYRWIINGTAIDGALPTLGDLIERAKVVLNPSRATMTVIGHGDAHFGNILLEKRTDYLYYDPAFAGRHSPILDIVKPFFHNVFANWMYFPREVERDLQITVAIEGEAIFVEHNYDLTPERRAILDTKLEYLLKPLLALLHDRDALPADWEEIFRLALMCCPLLTVNLLDREKRSAKICWLGLSQTLEMGNFVIDWYKKQ